MRPWAWCIGSRIALTVVGLAACPAARAAATVCDEPSAESFASIAFVEHEHSSIDERAGSTNQENQDFDLLVTSESGRFAWGFAHRYLIFDFSGIEPQTNAHLHTSFVPLHWTSEGPRTVRFSLGIALSASSNVMAHPREWESETLQLLAALVATSRLSDAVSLRYGVCGDHSFGEYRVYPALTAVWRPGARWLVEVGFPASLVRLQMTESLSSTVRIAPDGNEWHVKDRDFVSGSSFVYEAVALEWTTDWRAHPRLTLSLRLGRQLENRYEMTLADGERVPLSGEPANRLGFGVRWEF